MVYVLLEFCLEGDTEAMAQLPGCPLLPLADGTVGEFGKPDSDQCFYLVTREETAILEQLNGLLIDLDAPATVLARLSDPSVQCHTNLVTMEWITLVNLLPRLLPTGYQDQVEVAWDHKTVPRGWLAHFWHYALSSPDHHLFGLEAIPLLPTEQKTLRGLQEAQPTLLHGAGAYPGGVVEAAASMGCRTADFSVLVPELPEGSSAGGSEAEAAAARQACVDRLGGYLLPPTGLGLLQGLSRGLGHGKGEDLSLSGRDVLRMYYAQEALGKALPTQPGPPRTEAKAVLSQLPIYRCHAGGGLRVSLSGGDKRIVVEGSGSHPLAGPLWHPSTPGILPACFLDLSSPDGDNEAGERALIDKFLETPLVPKHQAYTEHILPRLASLPPSVQQEAMLELLLDYDKLQPYSTSLTRALQALPFVPPQAAGSRLKSPGELFDPEATELEGLVDAEELPDASFQGAPALAALRRLGMRTALDIETAAQAASSVHRLAAEGEEEKGVHRAKSLLRYLDMRADTILGSPAQVEEFRTLFETIPWLPVLAQPTKEDQERGLPWDGSKPNRPRIAAAAETRPYSDAWCVSHSLSLLDGECRSELLRRVLGFNTAPPVHAVAAQLVALSHQELTASARKKLAVEVPKLYVYLHAAVGTPAFEACKASLLDAKSIYIRDRFVSPANVAFSTPVDAVPYLYVVPPELLPLSSLFKALSVREQFLTCDFQQVLNRVHEDHPKEPLPKPILDMCLILVQSIAETFAQGELVFVPDAHGALHLASYLVYDDAPWVGEKPGQPTNKPNAVTFVHHRISNAIAAKVGCKSRRRQLLDTGAASIGVDLPGGGGIEGATAFGQSESLTRRLRNILDLYADGPGIMYEMIQNADDAGASKVGVLFDTSQHGTTSLMSSKMADWQGPALYVYNNEVFKEKDFVNLAKIGQGSKLDRLTATGRFGLGFNAVYHFTDLPSFISGDHLVMFDPHTGYVSYATASLLPYMDI